MKTSGEILEKLETGDFDALIGVMETEWPARAAYLLMEQIYHRFGFESKAMPYVDMSGSVPKLDAVKLVEKPLPNELPSGY